MLKIWLFVLPVLFAGCSNDAPRPVKKTQTDRLAKAEVALSKTPVPRTYSIQGNQLQVLEVPVADNSGFVDIQRCFVFRDAEFKTSSISCGQQPDVIISGDSR